MHHIPRTQLEQVEKKIIDRRFRKDKDNANTLLHFDDYNAKDEYAGWWYFNTKY